MTNRTLKEMKQVYKVQYKNIQKALKSYSDKWEKGSDEDVLAELLFCILTPQSKAKGCWSCMVSIIDKGLLLKGNEKQILAELKYPRFKYKKAKYFVEARDKFVKNGKAHIKDFMRQFKDPYEMRDWFHENIKGYGLKETGHFLRNVGFGEDIAILDRHILRNLKKLGVIREVPTHISPKLYHEIEMKMKAFAKKQKIPMAALDLILWAKETGEVFK
ncbi:MAG: N-glycosylase/DNA lyase [Spirochaetia bacterium]|nr:N-glycosylase/DNA lyase [Spirochaetia bacterium]